MPFKEVDVSVDQQAAMEMVRRTRQMGVPVIADEQEAIVGFDQPRLKQMAARHKGGGGGGGLGLRVTDAKDGQGPGAYVGSVREDSPSAKVGIQPGDVVIELSGRPVESVADLEQIAARRPPGQPTSIMVKRGDERHTFVLPG